MVTIKRKLNVSVASRGRIAIRSHDPNAEPPRPRPSSKLPRISRLMALAIRFNEMIRTGEASDMIQLGKAVSTSNSALANCMRCRLHHVTQFIVGLLLLAIVVDGFHQFVETKHGFHSVCEQRTVIRNFAGSPIGGRVGIELGKRRRAEFVGYIGQVSPQEQMLAM